MSRFRQPAPLAVSIAVFLLAAIVAGGLIWWLEQNRLETERARVADMADDHIHALSTHIERALSASYALAALVRQGNGSVSNFDALGRQLLPFYPGVSSLSLAPGGIIRSVVPLAGNEKAIGSDLLTNPETRKEASIARDTGTLTLVGPFTLVQGEVAAIGRLPIFLDDATGKSSFWGFSNVVISLSETLADAGLAQMRDNGFDYELWRLDAATARKRVISASSSTTLVSPVEHTLRVPNGIWTLGVAPVKGWGDPAGLLFKAALGLLFSLLVAYVAKLLIALRVHEKGLEALVAQRTADVKLREADLNRAQSVAQVGSWVVELPERRFQLSAEAGRILGGGTDRLLNLDAFLGRVHPGDRDALERAFQEALEGKPLDIEHRLVVGAETRWMHEHADLELAPDATPWRFVGTVQDVTRRKQAEEGLRTAEEKYRGLVEQSIAGSYIIQDGKFAYVNPRFAEIFGYGLPDELIGRDALSLVAEEDRGTVAENVRRRTTGKLASISYEFTGLRKDGSTIVVGVHGARATHRDRPAVLGLIQDISEKKRAEEEIHRYVEQLKTAFMSSVEVATVISEMRDPYTAGHERRVAKIAVAIGAELGFDARRLEGLLVAGGLHDVGKITIPSEILSKPGKLSAIEFQLIQGHPQAGYDVLKGVKFPWPVAEVALQHHERVDGSGYPQGLKGEAILLEARIMAVADVVEAMSSHRPYRPGLGIDKALAEIERGRGTAYDTSAADACLKLFREKGYKLPE